jgi:outer membrane protein
MRSRDRTSLALAALLGLGRAAQGQPAPPAAAAPTIPAGDAPTDQAPPERPLPPAPVMSFDQAIRQALQRHPSALVAEGEIRRFEAVARETRAGWLPTLFANGAYTRLDDDRKFGTRLIAKRDSTSGNLTLTVPLIVPQKWAASSRARDQIDLSRSSRADVRRQVALSVARAYLLVVSQKRVVEVSESAGLTARAHFDYSRTRFQGGLGNRVDMVRAEQEVATDDGIVETARASLVRAREALGALVGTDTAVDAVEPSLGTPPPLDAALSESGSRRTDVKVQKDRLHVARHSESLNYTDYLPYLTALVQPFYQNPPSLTMPLFGWQAQLVLTVPLYDGGLRYGQADERAALTSEARASLDGVLRQARSEVRAAFDSVMRAESALAATRRAGRLAQQALELATIAYRAGATGNLEVIDAERRSRDAAIQVTAAEDTLRQARLDLLAASGRFPAPDSR